MSRILDRARVLPVVGMIVILLLPVPVALANSIPSLTLWLVFGDQTSGHPDLEGVQLIGCDTPECSQPTLLLQYGRCNSAGCLDGSPSLQAVQDLQCFTGRCVAVFYNYSEDVSPPFRIVGQFSDRVRQSDLLEKALPGVGSAEWYIAVRDTALAVSVSPARSIQNPYDPYFDSFLWFFALTIVTELLVAALALRAWLKIRGKSLPAGLGYVLLANLISYPVAWIFWPSLSRFQPMELRQTGYLVILGAGFFTALVAGLSRQEGKARRPWLILTLVLLPVGCIITFVFLFVTGYGGAGRIAVPGLPPSLTIVLAELFAVAFEALLLYLLARKTLSLSAIQAALISLVMNASSLVTGLILNTWL
jgi:hypothetical protein